MSKVKKYSLDEETCEMIETNIGGWFAAEDYYTLQDENQKLKKQVEAMKCCGNCGVNDCRDACGNNYGNWKLKGSNENKS